MVDVETWTWKDFVDAGFVVAPCRAVVAAVAEAAFLANDLRPEMYGIVRKKLPPEDAWGVGEAVAEEEEEA